MQKFSVDCIADIHLITSRDDLTQSETGTVSWCNVKYELDEKTSKEHKKGMITYVSRAVQCEIICLKNNGCLLDYKSNKKLFSSKHNFGWSNSNKCARDTDNSSCTSSIKQNSISKNFVTNFKKWLPRTSRASKVQNDKEKVKTCKYIEADIDNLNSLSETLSIKSYKDNWQQALKVSKTSRDSFFDNTAAREVISKYSNTGDANKQEILLSTDVYFNKNPEIMKPDKTVFSLSKNCNSEITLDCKNAPRQSLFQNSNCNLQFEQYAKTMETDFINNSIMANTVEPKNKTGDLNFNVISNISQPKRIIRQLTQDLAYDIKHNEYPCKTNFLNRCDDLIDDATPYNKNTLFNQDYIYPRGRFHIAELLVNNTTPNNDNNLRSKSFYYDYSGTPSNIAKLKYSLIPNKDYKTESTSFGLSLPIRTFSQAGIRLQDSKKGDGLIKPQKSQIKRTLWTAQTNSQNSVNSEFHSALRNKDNTFPRPQSTPQISGSINGDNMCYISPNYMSKLRTMSTGSKYFRPECVNRPRSCSTNYRITPHPINLKNTITNFNNKPVKHFYYLSDLTNLETILADPTDRRIKAVCDRYVCDIEVYSKIPKNGTLSNIIVLSAPSIDNLQKCVRSLEYSMKWHLIPKLK